MNLTTFQRSSSDNPINRQIRVLKVAYLTGDGDAFLTTSTSIRHLGSSPPAGGPSAPPVQSTASDHVDCVLNAVEILRLSATNSTSAG